MTHYFFTNIALSLSVLMFLYGFSGLKPRLKVYISLSAMLAWLMPWQYLQLPQKSMVVPMVQRIDAMQPLANLANTVVPKSSTIEPQIQNVEFIFILLACMGLCVFIFRIVKQAMYLYGLSKSASLHSTIADSGTVEIRIIPNSNTAFTAGVFKPRIWIGDQLVGSNKLECILRHELTHIKSGDNILAIIVEFFRDVFFWNPLIWALSKRCKQDIELACDEACQKLDERYSVQLGELLMEKHRSENLAFANSIYGLLRRTGRLSESKNKNFNLYRLSRLIEENKMKFKIKHIPAIFGLVFLMLSGIAIPLFAVESGIQTYNIKIVYVHDSKKDVANYRVLGEGLIEQLSKVADEHGVKYENRVDKNLKETIHLYYPDSLAGFNALDRKVGSHQLEIFDIDASAKEQQASVDDLFNAELIIIGGDKKERHFSLLATNKNWSGLRYDNVTVRLYPVLKGDQVFVMMNVSELQDGKVLKSITPSIITGLGEEGIIGHNDSPNQVLPAEIKLTINRAAI